MRALRTKTTVVIISTVAAAALIGVHVLHRVYRVAGLPSTYAAVDHDPRLLKEAATARPIIDALSRYRTEHGHFPADIASLGVAAHEWVYSQQPSGYILTKKLGWDPVLNYRFEHIRGHWVFEPGDGSAEREITL